MFKFIIPILFIFIILPNISQAVNNQRMPYGGGGGGGGGGGYSGNPTGPNIGGYSPEQMEQMRRRQTPAPAPAPPPDPAIAKSEAERATNKTLWDTRNLVFRSMTTTLPINPCKGCYNSDCDEKFARAAAATLAEQLEKAAPGVRVEGTLRDLTQGIYYAQKRGDHVASRPTTPRATSEYYKKLIANTINAKSTSILAATTFPVDTTKYIAQQIEVSNLLSTSKFEVLSDYAVDSAHAINSFLAGTASGLYSSAEQAVMTPVRVAQLIYNDPTVLTRLSTNVMNSVTSGEMIAKVGDAFHEFQMTMAYGSAYEKGFAAGELAGNVLLIATGLPGLSASDKAAMTGLTTTIVEADVPLGAKLLNSAKTIPALSKQMSATDKLIEAATPAFELNRPLLQEIRTNYNLEMSSLPRVADTLKASGQSSEVIARNLHSLRREIGVKFKDMTPEEVRVAIYARNIEQYGDPLGPSIDYLRSQGKTWEEIIESASRTNKKVNNKVEG